MHCTQVRKNLLAYIKDEFAQKKIIADHLRACDSCRHKHQQIFRHLTLYGKLTEMEFAPGHWARMKHKLVATKTQNKLPLRNNRLHVFAAMGVLILGIVLWSLSATNNWRIEEIHEQNRRTRALRIGAVVKTPMGKIAMCYSPRQYTIILGSNTEVALQKTQRLQLRRGELFVNIKPPNKLIIDTEIAVVYVKGTIFSVRYHQNVVMAKVYQGSIELRNEQGMSTAKRGETVTALLAQKPQPARKTKEPELPWWNMTPISLTLEADSTDTLRAKICNTSSAKITLPHFSGATPHFLLHVKTQTASYSTPLNSLATYPLVSPLKIPVASSYVLSCDISSLAKQPGSYSFTLVYQVDRKQLQVNGGIWASPPLRITVP